MSCGNQKISPDNAKCPLEDEMSPERLRATETEYTQIKQTEFGLFFFFFNGKNKTGILMYFLTILEYD